MLAIEYAHNFNSSEQQVIRTINPSLHTEDSTWVTVPLCLFQRNYPSCRCIKQRVGELHPTIAYQGLGRWVHLPPRSSCAVATAASSMARTKQTERRGPHFRERALKRTIETPASSSQQPPAVITSDFLDGGDTKLPGLALVLLNWKLPPQTVPFIKKGSIYCSA